MLKDIILLKQNNLNKKKIIISVLLLILGSKLFFSILKVTLGNVIHFNLKEHPINISIREDDYLLNIIFVFINAVILTPVIEELSFRYGVSYNVRKIIWGLSFLISFLILIFFELYKELSFFSENLSFYVLMLPSTFIVSGILFRFSEFIGIVLKKTPIFIFVLFSSFLFALVHLNVIGKQESIFAYGFLLLPYFVSGYLYSYVRINIGIKYGILLHALNNFILLTLGLLLS